MHATPDEKRISYQPNWKEDGSKRGMYTELGKKSSAMNMKASPTT